MPLYPPSGGGGGEVTFSSVNAALATANADIDVNAQKIVDMGTPSATGDAATKGYVDALIPFFAAAPEEVTSASGGGANLSLATPISRITSDASAGVSRVNLPNGTYTGQVHYVYWLTEGASGDAVRCYPATFTDGTYSNIGFRVLYGYVWTGATWKQFLGTSIV